MKRIFKSFILAIALIILLTVPVLAAYTSMITVTESAGTSYTKLPIMADMNTTGLVTSGFISSTGLDTRVKSGSTELPHMLANDKLLFVSDIDASQSKQFTFSTSNAPLESFPIIVGEGGYITTADDADLELHDSFVLEMSVYLANTGVVFEKQDCLKLAYNASTEELTLTAGNEGTPDYTLTATNVEPGLHTITLSAENDFSGEYVLSTLRPTADGSEHSPSRIPSGSYDGTDYSLVDDESPDEDTTVVASNADSFTSLFKTDTPNVLGISSVSVYVRARITTYGSGANCYPLLKISNTDYIPEFIYNDLNQITTSEMGLDYKTTHATWATNPHTGETWTPSDIENLEFGVEINSHQSLGYIRATQIYLVINAQSSYATSLMLYVDGNLGDSAIMDVPIPDTANDWEWFVNPYFEYIVLETAN